MAPALGKSSGSPGLLRGEARREIGKELETKTFVFVVFLYSFVKRGKERELASLRQRD